MLKIIVNLSLIFFSSSCFCKDIKKLSWLSGAWVQAQTNSTFTTLTVSELRGKKYFGTESTLKLDAGKVLIQSFENFEIRDGSPIELEVFPQGQKSLVMKATAVTKNKIVFENKKHDFPQQWSFELLKNGTLVETAKGRGQKIELKFHRSIKK